MSDSNASDFAVAGAERSSQTHISYDELITTIYFSK